MLRLKNSSKKRKEFQGETLINQNSFGSQGCLNSKIYLFKAFL